MHIFIIAAVAENGVIGSNGNLAWHLPADQEFFFNQIKDAMLISGRTSFESAHGSQTFQELDRVIILTRQENYQVPGAKIVNNLPDAFTFAHSSTYREIAVLGGAKVYEEAINQVDELLITEIHQSFEGDTFFPEIDQEVWKEYARESFPADEINPYPYSFVRYRKR